MRLILPQPFEMTCYDNEPPNAYTAEDTDPSNHRTW